MVTAFKRSRINRGKNSWTNVTTRNNGTSSRSTSNKVGNVTTNVSAKGVVRRTQNNNGWIQRTTWNPNTANKTKKSKPVGLTDAQRNKAIKNIAKMFSSDKPKAPKVSKVKSYTKSSASRAPVAPKTLVQRRTYAFRDELRSLNHKENPIVISSTKKNVFTKYNMMLIMLLVVGIIVYFI